MTEPSPGQDEPSPWGFRILLILAGVYLLLRLVQGVQWVIQRLG